MTDPKTTPASPGGRDPKAPLGSSPGVSRRFPPLGWIVLGALVLIVGLVVVNTSGALRTPHGAAVPTADSRGEMPAAPSTGSAPSTPATSS
jgi:hypothetical protein